VTLDDADRSFAVGATNNTSSVQCTYRMGPTPEVTSVLMIDKTAVLEKYQQKCEELAAYPDIDLTLFAPEVWAENFQEIPIEKTTDPNYDIRTGRCFFKGYENRGFYYDLALPRAIRDERPDVICMLEEPFSLFALETVFFRNRFAPDASLVFYTSDNHSWNHDYPYRPSFIYERIFKYTAANADYAAAVNEESRRILESKGFDAPIERFSWGLDRRYFRERDVPGLRDRLGLDGPVVGYVGRLLEIKGITTLLEAVAGMDERVSVLIVGDGPDRDTFESTARDLGIADRTVFAGYVEPEEIDRYYSLMDTLVLPSHEEFKERFGRVLIEAMACDVPVVASETGGIPEVVDDAGLLFEDRNVERLRGHLQTVLYDESTRSELIRRGERRVEANYTWRAFAEQLHDIVQQVTD
jgi:glycosyltransferase involved in cell wall biosynthesis